LSQAFQRFFVEGKVLGGRFVDDGGFDFFFDGFQVVHFFFDGAADRLVLAQAVAAVDGLAFDGGVPL